MMREVEKHVLNAILLQLDYLSLLTPPLELQIFQPFKSGLCFS